MDTRFYFFGIVGAGHARPAAFPQNQFCRKAAGRTCAAPTTLPIQKSIAGRGLDPSAGGYGIRPYGESGPVRVGHARPRSMAASRRLRGVLDAPYNKGAALSRAAPFVLLTGRGGTPCRCTFSTSGRCRRGRDRCGRSSSRGRGPGPWHRYHRAHYRRWA